MDGLHIGDFFVSRFLDMSDISPGMPVTCFFKNFEFSCVSLRIYLSGGTSILIMAWGTENAQCGSLYQMKFPRIETLLRMSIQ